MRRVRRARAAMRPGRQPAAAARLVERPELTTARRARGGQQDMLLLTNHHVLAEPIVC